MAPTQRHDRGKLAFRFYSIWRPPGAVPISMHITMKILNHIGNSEKLTSGKFHQKFVEELCWIDEPMVSEEAIVFFP